MSQHGTPCFLLILVLLLSDHMSHSQHWSYGLRPGGKREIENIQDTYPESQNEVSLFTEPQHLGCSLPQSRIGLMKEALINWLEGETGRKKM
ncbi:progonadoliberin-1 [Hyla sarda]|uniref:progonadoliberin-1 n=1 Tax=Hyla sarda TaxID=327740 RepID=UPI0024C2EEA6|nr:progonadoliberin-1 [Hyla sarda]XP_056427122.1 progonadoliberin-1 [Hyla sarda]